MNAVLMPAAMEMMSVRSLMTAPIGASAAAMCCGLTLSRSIFASRAASALSSTHLIFNCCWKSSRRWGETSAAII